MQDSESQVGRMLVIIDDASGYCDSICITMEIDKVDAFKGDVEKNSREIRHHIAGCLSLLGHDRFKDENTHGINLSRFGISRIQWAHHALPKPEEFDTIDHVTMPVTIHGIVSLLDMD